jgi:hypothetical protein
MIIVATIIVEGKCAANKLGTGNVTEVARAGLLAA